MDFLKVNAEQAFNTAHAVSNDAADTATTRVADRTVCCTLPPYRLVKSVPAQLILVATAGRPVSI